MTDQARVIAEAVDALPSDAESWVSKAGTEFLLDKAADHDAKALSELGRRLLEVVDPAAADVEEAKRLEAEERDARAIGRVRVTTSPLRPRPGWSRGPVPGRAPRWRDRCARRLAWPSG